ncbi:MAG: S8 family serine peptidase [Rhodoferax sp.]|nr:S8 family serine peptidase [Rhodoferax sp.]
MEAQAAAQANPLARAQTSSKKIPATVRFSGDGLAELKVRGVAIHSVLGDVATVLIPADRLAEIAALPQVLQIETPSRPVARLNKSVAFTKADQLRTGSFDTSWTGKTGKGVLVGVIDTGIDISHGDFLDANGKTRILRMWNQRSVTGGTPPMGSDGTTPLYGAECDSAAINAVVGTSASASSLCNPDDTGNHGSHVAGIAAGNGRGTGNNQAAGRFVGMAPEADLLVANSIDKAVSANGDPVLDAISWMTRVAKQLGKPLVINLSLGSYFGSRDGTGGFQSGIDNISGPGVIIVAAAGNEGSAPIRTEIPAMTQGQTVAVTFSIPAGRTAEQLEFWSDGDNQYAVQLVCPNAVTTDFVTAGNSLPAFDSAGCGQIKITSTAPSPANGDRQYNMSLGSGTNPLAAGNWTLNIRADAVPVSQTLGVISGESAEGAAFTGNFATRVTTGILTDSSSARRAIAVAALNTNYQWNTASGPTDKQLENGPLGDVGTFSSRGPRRICSANAKYIDVSTPSGQRNRDECTKPVMKPEITAPGSYIMSALAGAAKAAATAADIEADGVHVAYMGTSMATPHVTGAVALLLQTNPTLTPEDAKRLLFSKLQTNSFTQAANLPVFSQGVDMPPSPNYAWGYGAMDISLAMAAALPTSTINIVAGWNLLGNSVQSPLDVATAFGDTAKVTTVWKWVPSTSRWAFYAPSMNAVDLAAYAVSKSYDLLSSIQAGEGFWVNAKVPFTANLPTGTAVASSTFADKATPPNSLPAGWSLIAVGDKPTPRSFVNSIATAQPIAPAVAATSLTTLWAWENAVSKWLFYAPSLDNSNGLSGYVTSKDYLDFGTKTLDPTIGFWVNHP